MTQKKWWLSHILLIFVLSLSTYQFWQIRTQSDRVTFLDVGQGDAILIQTTEGKNILIDAGPNGKVVQELSKKLNFFNPQIDLFILTHPDLDHYGGTLDILQKYPIKSVMLTGVSSRSRLYVAFLEELREKDIPLQYPQNDQDLRISPNLYMDFIYPFKNQHLMGLEVKNKNDTSISLILRNAQKEPLMLLTGDGEEKQEQELLLSDQDLSAPIFKLGHHGSKTSSSPNLLKAVDANTFVVSAGKDNKFGHPHPEVIERLNEKTILSTAQISPIEFVLK